jgi:Tfp pilus assembly protein PilO
LEGLIQFLEKLPAMMLLFIYCGYLGYDYYNFMTDPSSVLKTKAHEVTAAEEDLTNLKNKIKRVNEFSHELNGRKTKLRALAQQLETTKAVISETIDVPGLMRTVLHEAKRVGLTVSSLKPGGTRTADYYGEREFQFDSSGVYFQYVAFLDRIANLQEILRVENLKFQKIALSNTKIVTLRATIQFKAYRYIGSQADELGKGGATSATMPPAAKADASSTAKPKGATQ